MNASRRIQNASVCMSTTINAETAEHAEPNRPAGSAGSALYVVLRLHGLDDRRHDLEQVADDAVVGDLEDRRVGILVDGDDRARALHADEMLDRAGDAEREIQLRRDG